jgi:hypothetical protein
MVCLLASSGAAASGGARYGAPVSDPAGIIDLPPGFHYEVVARTGDEMSDGLPVPALPDGMGAFPGPDGTTIVVCNHECKYPRDGAFGEDGGHAGHIDVTKVYDPGDGRTPVAGGTTTFVWDTRAQALVHHELSLAGTLFNCAGGTTPWGTWLSCEEKTYRAGYRGDQGLVLQRDHGYVFEVPARPGGGLADPVPLTPMGRFTHESVAYDARSGVLYQTEDLHDGLFYRFVPARRGNLRAGGRLQALAFGNGTRESDNQTPGVRLEAGRRLKVKWIDLDAPDSPDDDLRARGHALGAARFNRGEGLCMLNGTVYVSCTMGGAARAGQIWRYVPSRWEGRAGERRSPGHAELFYEVADTTALLNPDNLTTTPSGDVMICEDPEYGSTARLIILTPEGETSTFARARLPGELSGACFSPDNGTLFVNLQKAGITLAVTGPWRNP